MAVIRTSATTYEAADGSRLPMLIFEPDEFPPDPGLLWRPETAGTAVPGWIFASRQDQRPAW